MDAVSRLFAEMALVVTAEPALVAPRLADLYRAALTPLPPQEAMRFSLLFDRRVQEGIRAGDQTHDAKIFWVIWSATRGITKGMATEGMAAPEAALLVLLAPEHLLREQSGAILAAAKRGLMAGEPAATWQPVLNHLHNRFSHHWSPAEAAMLAALRSGAGQAGSPWLGPRAGELAAAMAGGDAWAELLEWVGREDGGSKPSRKFLARAAALLQAIGPEAYGARVMALLTAHPLDPATPDPDADGLKQLVWMLGLAGDAAGLARLAERCFDKVAGIGARSTKLGNAALLGLSLIEPPTRGAAALDRLRRRVRQPSAKAMVEKALEAAAKRAGMSAEDLAEMATPDCGLDETGVRRFAGAGGAAVLSLAGGRVVALDWHDEAGALLTAPGGALKAGAAGLVKEAKDARTELERVLATATARIESGYETNRAWDLGTWTARFLGHALLRPLAGRLIWQVTLGNGETVAVRPEGALLRTRDGAVLVADPASRIALWHPIDAAVADILAWREALREAGITQPFKQAHREVYRLTDAERGTATYSNRFAGHVLRQHQMVELAKARGWSAGLQGGFDGGEPPTKTYPAFGLRVTFGCEAPEDGDAPMSAAGIFVHVYTDAVRFRAHAAAAPARRPANDQTLRMLRRISAAPRPAAPAGYKMRPADAALADVPARCFSEAMRDVDLFVGVASLGADPQWRDGGPGGRHGAYWRGFAAAELTASGESRRAALEALLPLLALGRVARIDGRYLQVQGKRFRYRIHLGSGSIFADPPGEYVCIVADGRAADAAPLLPFEGDAMLSLILSKAMLLADDDKIKDKAILSQLARLDQ